MAFVFVVGLTAVDLLTCRYVSISSTVKYVNKRFYVYCLGVNLVLVDDFWPSIHVYNVECD